MKGLNTKFSVRRALLRIAPAAFTAGILSAQSQFSLPQGLAQDGPQTGPDEGRLPNGKSRQEAIVRAEYDQNLKDARELIEVAKAFEEALEKDDRFILSLSSLRKLDDIERLTRKIRGRLKHS